MQGPLVTLVTAAGVFTGTAVDDFVLLTVLFLASRVRGRPRWWQIWIGQYAGVGVLVAVSVIAALGLTVVPDRWVGLLGLVPIALGVRGLVQVIRARRDGVEPAPVAAGVASVAALTVASGADNISAFTPLFRALGMEGSLLTVAAFAVLVAAWCAAASRVAAQRRAINAIRRSGHWLGPILLVAVGGLILTTSGLAGVVTR